MGFSRQEYWSGVPLSHQESPYKGGGWGHFEEGPLVGLGEARRDHGWVLRRGFVDVESWALKASYWHSVEAGCVEGQTGTRKPGYGTAPCPGRQYWVLNDIRAPGSSTGEFRSGITNLQPITKAR